MHTSQYMQWKLLEGTLNLHLLQNLLFRIFVRCSVSACFYLFMRSCHSWITKGNQQIWSQLTQTHYFCQQFHPIFIRVSIDVAAGEIGHNSKYAEDGKENKIYISLQLQSGPRVRVTYFDCTKTKHLPNENYPSLGWGWLTINSPDYSSWSISPWLLGL